LPKSENLNAQPGPAGLIIVPFLSKREMIWMGLRSKKPKKTMNAAGEGPETGAALPG